MPPECMTMGFSVQDLILLMGAILGVVGLPVGIQFRASQAQNRELMDLLKDQLEIQREQVATLKATEQVIRDGTRTNNRRPRA